jgi:hypothetical protein
VKIAVLSEELQVQFLPSLSRARLQVGCVEGLVSVHEVRIETRDANVRVYLRSCPRPPVQTLTWILKFLRTS